MTARLAGADRAFAFLDLETTGGDPTRDRITEVGIVFVEEGRITGEWSSLVDPGVPIPAMIQSLTGITQAMVAGAPSFDALADTIRAQLADRTLVAHNARFDHGFLKAAFRRLDQRLTIDALCTVRLSRRLFPEHARHGLDALIARHALDGRDRHRALGDARAIARFYCDVAYARHREALDAALDRLLSRSALPSWLDAEQLETLPERAGVYVFRGVTGMPLYVGKARNLRERVQAHFHADSRSSNDARLSAEMRSLDIEETPSEFSALLREIELVRAHAPLHNVLLRRRETVCFVQAPPFVTNDEPADSAGPAPPVAPAPRIVRLQDIDPTREPYLYGPFGTRQAARNALAALGKEHRLCDKAIGLWTGERACFSRQIGRCHGLCCGMEPPATHHARLLEALAPLGFPPWPFAGPVVFHDADPERNLSQRLCFDRWCSYDQLRHTAQPFDVDVYRLLRRVVRQSPDAFEPLNSRSLATDVGSHG